jgi:CC2D2A N-terminal C2 domain
VDASRDAPVQCSIPIQEKFHLLVSSWPHSVTLRLYEAPRRAHLLSLRSQTLLAEVPVAVPGAPGTLSSGYGVQSIEWACPTYGGMPVWDGKSETGQEAPHPVYPEGKRPKHLKFLWLSSLEIQLMS